jgi:hypothetical protein
MSLKRLPEKSSSLPALTSLAHARQTRINRERDSMMPYVVLYYLQTYILHSCRYQFQPNLRHPVLYVN